MPETDGSGSSRIISRKSRDIQLQETHNIILRRHKEKTLLIPHKENPGIGAPRQSCFMSDTMPPALPCLLQPSCCHLLARQMSSPEKFLVRTWTRKRNSCRWLPRGPACPAAASPVGLCVCVCVCDIEDCTSVLCRVTHQGF